jgi:hypothetical protein
MLADLRPDCECIEEDRLTLSSRYVGQLPTFIKCISRHTLYCILKVIGNQYKAFKSIGDAVGFSAIKLQPCSSILYTL